jgi:hypothetical protein
LQRYHYLTAELLNGMRVLPLRNGLTSQSPVVNGHPDKVPPPRSFDPQSPVPGPGPLCPGSCRCYYDRCNVTAWPSGAPPGPPSGLKRLLWGMEQGEPTILTAIVGPWPAGSECGDRINKIVWLGWASWPGSLDSTQATSQCRIPCFVSELSERAVTHPKGGGSPQS